MHTDVLVPPLALDYNSSESIAYAYPGHREGDTADVREKMKQCGQRAAGGVWC